MLLATQSHHNNKELLPKEGAAVLNLEETLTSKEVSRGSWCFPQEALVCPWVKMLLGLRSFWTGHFRVKLKGVWCQWGALGSQSMAPSQDGGDILYGAEGQDGAGGAEVHHSQEG